MNRQTRNSDKPELWRANLIELRNKSGLTYKQIAEKENIGEKTVVRVFSGESKNPGVVVVRKIVHALGGTINDVFEDSGAVIGSQGLASLQDEVTRLTEENARLTSSLNLANIELSVQKDKITALENENKMLNLKIEYEEKLIAVHNFYNKMMPNS